MHTSLSQRHIQKMSAVLKSDYVDPRPRHDQGLKTGVAAAGDLIRAAQTKASGETVRYLDAAVAKLEAMGKAGAKGDAPAEALGQVTRLLEQVQDVRARVSAEGTSDVSDEVLGEISALADEVRSLDLRGPTTEKAYEDTRPRHDIGLQTAGAGEKFDRVPGDDPRDKSSSGFRKTWRTWKTESGKKLEVSATWVAGVSGGDRREADPSTTQYRIFVDDKQVFETRPKPTKITEPQVEAELKKYGVSLSGSAPASVGTSDPAVKNAKLISEAKDFAGKIRELATRTTDARDKRAMERVARKLDEATESKFKGTQFTQSAEWQQHRIAHHYGAAQKVLGRARESAQRELDQKTRGAK